MLELICSQKSLKARSSCTTSCKMQNLLFNFVYFTTCMQCLINIIDKLISLSIGIQMEKRDHRYFLFSANKITVEPHLRETMPKYQKYITVRKQRAKTACPYRDIYMDIHMISSPGEGIHVHGRYCRICTKPPTERPSAA